MFPSLFFLSLQSGVDSRSPFLVSSSYILVMVSVLLPVFVFLQSRPAFSVFSFTSPVSSCLIHSCCVPNMFPLTVSFLMCIYCVSFPFSLVYMSPCLKCLGISRCSKFNEFTFPSLGFCDYFLFSWFSCLFNIFLKSSFASSHLHFGSSDIADRDMPMFWTAFEGHIHINITGLGPESIV